MAQVTEAIYAHGVLRPKDDLALREAQRVRLIVEPLDDDTDRADRSAALRRLREGIEGMKFLSSEPLPSRDELHDRSRRKESRGRALGEASRDGEFRLSTSLA